MATIFDIINRNCPAKPGLGGNFFTLSGKSEKIGFRTQKNTEHLAKLCQTFRAEKFYTSTG